ncbi:MAG: hypothetical protein V9E94_14595 [Microthrixaceae bacterium]
MADPVELVGRDAGCDVSTDLDESVGGDASGDPHRLDLGLCADRPRGPIRRGAGSGVVGSVDADGNGPHR